MTRRSEEVFGEQLAQALLWVVLVCGGFIVVALWWILGRTFGHGSTWLHKLAFAAWLVALAGAIVLVGTPNPSPAASQLALGLVGGSSVAFLVLLLVRRRAAQPSPVAERSLEEVVNRGASWWED